MPLRPPAFLTLALCASLSGCAHLTGPETHSIELTSTRPGSDLGRIGISFASVTTRVNLGAKPVTKAQATSTGAIEAGIATFSVFDGGGGYSGLVGLLLAPIAAAGAGAYGAMAGVSADDLETANRTMEAARAQFHPEEEIAAHLDHALGRDVDSGADAPRTRAPESCDTRMTLQWLDCRLTDGSGVNPSKSLRLRLRADLARTNDGTMAGRAIVQFESGGRRYTEWAANDARLLHAEWQRGLSSVTQQIVDWLAGKSVPGPTRPDAK